jgi:uncharacterized protein (DUF58 family)
MTGPITSTRGIKDTIRPLPFFFTRGFFLLFVTASITLLPLYNRVPGGIGLPLAVDFLILLLALADFFLGPSVNAIQMARPLPYPLAVDKSNEICLEVTNRTSSTVSLIVSDDIPLNCMSDTLPLRTSVRPAGRARISYRLIPLERGNGEFGNVSFWVKGRLGLVWKRGERQASQTVKLYPGLALIERHALRLRRRSVDEQVRAFRKYGAGMEFDSLRDYAVGDDFRLIHWGATARQGKMIVRHNRIERSQIIVLVLDAGRMMTARSQRKTKFDHSLNTALLLAHSALKVGDKVGIMVVGQEIEVFLPPSSAPGQLGRILDATYAVLPKLEEPRYYRALSGISGKLKRRSLVVLFTDLIDERSSAGLLRYSLGLLPRHLPLVVALSDSELLTLADTVPETAQDLYKQGVAAETLRRRELLVAKLSSLGAVVVDTPPERLSAAVLDRYLEIKTKNLL